MEVLAPESSAQDSLLVKPRLRLTTSCDPRLPNGGAMKRLYAGRRRGSDPMLEIWRPQVCSPGDGFQFSHVPFQAQPPLFTGGLCSQEENKGNRRDRTPRETVEASRQQRREGEVWTGAEIGKSGDKRGQYRLLQSWKK